MRLRTPGGASVAQLEGRMRGESLWLPRLLSDGVASGSSTRTDISPTAGTNTKGAWTEYVAALSADVGYVRFVFLGDASAAGLIFDIGVGAAGSETVRVPDINCGFAGYKQISPTWPHAHPGWLFPVFMPRGSRVAVRASQSTLTSPRCLLEFYSPTLGLVASTVITAMGVTAASSRGTNLTVPGGANTKGAWSQIIAATTEHFEALGVGVGGGGDNTTGSAGVLVDIGVGASGSEQIVIPDLYFTVDSSNDKFHWASALVHGVQVPKGSRLAARYAAASVNNTLDVILYGIRAAA